MLARQLKLLFKGQVKTLPLIPSTSLSRHMRAVTRLPSRGCVLTTLVLALRAPPRLIEMSVAEAGVSQLQLDQDRAVAARAEKERSLLQEGHALEALVQKGARTDSGGGFGAGPSKAAGGGKKAKGKAKAKPAKREPPRSVLGKEMQRTGVVRINGALAPATADALREFVDAERERATSEVLAGRRGKEERFANLVLVSNRCDLLLPLLGPPVDALTELLGEGSVLGSLLEELVGREAVFNVRRRPPHRRIAAAAGTAKREASGAQTKSPAIAVMLPTGPTPLTTAAARADGLGPRR